MNSVSCIPTITHMNLTYLLYTFIMSQKMFFNFGFLFLLACGLLVKPHLQLVGPHFLVYKYLILSIHLPGSQSGSRVFYLYFYFYLFLDYFSFCLFITVSDFAETVFVVPNLFLIMCFSFKITFCL